VLQLLSPRSDQHVAHEESMVSTGAHHANAYPVALVPSSISINNVDAVPGVEVVNRTLAVDSPDLELGVSKSALRVAELQFGECHECEGQASCRSPMRGSRAPSPPRARMRAAIASPSAMCLA
jgi:hypothetical protein